MSNRIPPVPSGITGPLATYLGQIARQLNGEAYLSIFSGTTPESIVTGIPGNLAVNVGVSDVDRLWVMSGTTARQKRTGWEAASGGTSPITTAVLSSDVSIASASASTITGLGLDVVAGQAYHWRYNIGFLKASNRSVKIQITHPGAQVYCGSVNIPQDNTDSSDGIRHVAVTFATEIASSNTIASTEDLYAWAEGIIIPNTTGTMQLRFGNGVGTSVSSVVSGSSAVLIAM